MLSSLPDHPEYRAPEPCAGPDHPMRRLTRGLAFGESWSPSDGDWVRGIFDGLAPDRGRSDTDPKLVTPLMDAIARGAVSTDGRWLELGSGTGAGRRALRSMVDFHVSVDLSTQLLERAPLDSVKVRADSSRLPFADGCATVVLLINMLLFPHEVARVLAVDGAVVWINTLGDQTPIYLPASDVIDVLPGSWTAVTSRAGTGTWTVARRIAPPPR